MMSRYKPIGWKYESYRHSLAAKGIRTALAMKFDTKKAFDEFVETRNLQNIQEAKEKGLQYNPKTQEFFKEIPLVTKSGLVLKDGEPVMVPQTVMKDPFLKEFEESYGGFVPPYPAEVPKLTEAQSEEVDKILQKQWASIMPGSVTSEIGTGFGAAEDLSVEARKFTYQPPEVVLGSREYYDFKDTGVPLDIGHLNMMDESERNKVLSNIQSRYGISQNQFMTMNHNDQNKILLERGRPEVVAIREATKQLQALQQRVAEEQMMERMNRLKVEDDGVYYTPMKFAEYGFGDPSMYSDEQLRKLKSEGYVIMPSDVTGTAFIGKQRIGKYIEDVSTPTKEKQPDFSYRDPSTGKLINRYFKEAAPKKDWMGNAITDIKGNVVYKKELSRDEQLQKWEQEYNNKIARFNKLISKVETKFGDQIGQEKIPRARSSRLYGPEEEMPEDETTPDVSTLVSVVAARSNKVNVPSALQKLEVRNLILGKKPMQEMDVVDSTDSTGQKIRTLEKTGQQKEYVGLRRQMLEEERQRKTPEYHKQNKLSGNYQKIIRDMIMGKGATFKEEANARRLQKNLNDAGVKGTYIEKSGEEYVVKKRLDFAARSQNNSSYILKYKGMAI